MAAGEGVVTTGAVGGGGGAGGGGLGAGGGGKLGVTSEINSA